MPLGKRMGLSLPADLSFLGGDASKRKVRLRILIMS